MLRSVTIEEIDQLLDELEQLAEKGTRRRFLLSLLDRMQYVLRAEGVAHVVPSDHQWLTLATGGRGVRSQIPPPDPSQLMWSSPDRRQLLVPVRRTRDEADWQRGGLLIAFPVAPSESELEELVKLCEAFAEVLALRQSRELDTFVNEKWPAFQQALNGLTGASTVRAAAYSVANDLVVLTQADRVTVVCDSWQGVRVLAISGVAEFQQNAQTVLAIQSLGRQALCDGKSLVHHANHQSDSEAHPPVGVLTNYLALPIFSHDRQEKCQTAIVIEWDDYDRLLLGCTYLQLMFPMLAITWLQHQRWLRVPRLLRRRARQRASLWGTWSMRLAKLSMLSVLLGGSWWLASLPTPLRIEASGTLQPVEQRIVFAPQDGLVTRILVKDGQLVRAGELLAELQSPMLEIELEEVAGELRANQEKLAGLKVAINQLSPEDPSARSMQNRFSSEMREIETWLVTLDEKQRALLGEMAKLKVLAPIQGTVIARQVDRYLERRPVRRGDPLLRVVELDGPWRLELEVADRDSGRVKASLFGDAIVSSGPVPESPKAEVEFVYAATPNKRFNAMTTWVSESARNPLGEEVIVDVHVSVSAETAAAGHMGATVQAYFDSGEYPFWFVWSRPLVEAIQRKLWF